MVIGCYCIDTYGAREVLAVPNWRTQEAYPYAQSVGYKKHLSSACALGTAKVSKAQEPVFCKSWK